MEYARPDNPNFQNALTGLSQLGVHSGLSAPDARALALASIYQQVQAQANSLAYIDTFMVLAVLSAIMIFVAFTLKKNDPGAGGAPRLE